MASFSSLAPQDQQTIKSLIEGRDVEIDDITGLFNRAKTAFYKDNPDVTDLSWSAGVSLVNDQPVPGDLLRTQNQKILVDEIVNGQRILVEQAIRLAGTRVGVHVHESGGLTLVAGQGRTIFDTLKGGPSVSAVDTVLAFAQIGSRSIKELSAIKQGAAITDFVEGLPNSYNPVGTYYYMPSNVPMSASNLTPVDVKLIDIFITPVGGAPITILEPGYP